MTNFSCQAVSPKKLQKYASYATILIEKKACPWAGQSQNGGPNALRIQKSAEDYLETILRLTLRNGSVRSIDIATELGFSKPSVSTAMKRLRENGYITVQPHGLIELTEQGRAIADKIYERHTLLTQYLVHLGVSHEVAEQDACKIEHILSEETFERIRLHAARSIAPDCPE